MKKKNIRVGMKVIIKDNAMLIGEDKVGDVMVVREIGEMGVFCTPPFHPLQYRSYYHFDEVKRVRGHAYL